MVKVENGVEKVETPVDKTPPLTIQGVLWSLRIDKNDYILCRVRVPLKHQIKRFITVGIILRVNH